MTGLLRGTPDPIEAAILAGAVAALRKRAAWRREHAREGVTHEKVVTIVSSEARADLEIAADLEAIAADLEQEAGR